MLRLGGVASASHMTVFQGLGEMFKREGIDMDWVLYSDYDAMIDDFVDGKIDLAWNGPLGYVKIKRLLDEPCQVIAMRDVDVNFTTCFVTRPDSDILTVEDLGGKRFAFASRSSVESGLLAYHFLKETGINPRNDLALFTFSEDRKSSGLTGEKGVIDCVLNGEYDAGSVAQRTLRTMSEDGSLPQDTLRTFWASPGYSHCCFTAQRDMDPGQYRMVEQALLSVDYGDPLGKSILDGEACKAFVPGIEEGWEELEKAAIDQGLV